MAKAARTAAARSGLRPPAIPKSPRGWRWFLAEFAVVAAGVLAALGAEQAVQTWNWRRDVAEAREAIHAELRVAAGFAFDNVTVWPCESRRIDRLSALLRTVDRHWEGEAGRGTNGRPQTLAVPYRPWLTSAWETAQATGVTAHMTQQERQRYAVLYTFIDTMSGRMVELNDAASELGVLTADTELSDTTRDRMLAALERAGTNGAFLAAAGQQFLDRMKPLRLPPPEPAREANRAVCNLNDAL